MSHAGAVDIPIHTPPRAAIAHAPDWDALRRAAAVIWRHPVRSAEREALCTLAARRAFELRGVVPYDEWQYNRHTDA